MWLGRKEQVINIINRNKELHWLQFWAEIFFARLYGIECQSQAISGINATLEISHSKMHIYFAFTRKACASLITTT